MNIRRSARFAKNVRRISHPVAHACVNAVAALVMAGWAILVPHATTHLYPAPLGWVPTAAFCVAALSRWKAVRAWLPFIALGLNAGSVLLCFLVGFASAAQVRTTPSALAFALTGAVVGGWNLFRLSTSLAVD